MSAPHFVFASGSYASAEGSAGARVRDLAEALAAEGHRVTVIAVRGPGDVARPDRETTQGVEVIRVGNPASPSAPLWQRIWGYVETYTLLGWRVWKTGAVEAVISLTDPPLQVVVVTLASGRARRRIHWAQDIYPEVAEELGAVPRDGILAKVLRWISTWALRRQDEVVAVGRCMRERLKARGVEWRRIEVIPNWSSVTPVTREDVAAKQRALGWEGKFVVLCPGSPGPEHDFETVIDAARRIRNSRIQIVFAGGEECLEEVRQAAEGVGNIGFFSVPPEDQLGAFLGAASLHLVTMRAGLSGLSVPDEIYAAFAVSRPAVFVGPADSEASRLLKDAGAGFSVHNGDAAGLAELLDKLAASPDMMRGCCEAAGRLAGRCSLRQALPKWREVLE